MSSNGQLTSAELTPIRGGLLRHDAAAAWIAMDGEAIRRGWGHLEVVDSYRPLGHPGDFARGHWSQWCAWEKYRYHGGNLAAQPGTSNHGLGLAVDMSRRTRWITDQIGQRFGWAKAWSDAPSEWWHERWREGHYPAIHAPFAVMHHGSTGPRVKDLQQRLRAKGFRSVKANGYFGVATGAAVVRIQHAHHLHADGIVGPATWKVIRS